MTLRIDSYLALIALGTCGGAPILAQEAPSPEVLAQLEQLERSFLYYPRVYGEATVEGFADRRGVRIDYRTSHGAQTAWWVPQRQGAAPERVWIFCGGNGSLALDFEPFVRALPFETDAFLLIDYPGYGACEGSPNPAAIRENVKHAIAAAGKSVGVELASEPSKLRAFGHSLGCAAALMAVEECKISGAVCYAPFTSTPEMARIKFFVSKDVPIQHVFDNRVALKALAANKGRVWILHGDRDEVIPVDMSRTLAAEFQEIVDLTVIAGGDHGDLFARAPKTLVEAMIKARK